MNVIPLRPARKAPTNFMHNLASANCTLVSMSASDLIEVYQQHIDTNEKRTYPKNVVPLRRNHAIDWHKV